jgi:hypothetical protein
MPEKHAEKHLSEKRVENLRRKCRQNTFIRKAGRKKLPAGHFSAVRQGASLFYIGFFLIAVPL